ncbi:thioredoxin [Haloarchaeobius sp. HRN-SO-5]|uniref:thioredoxin n=1 Tax=Haloarchaeobius sp. HRN-SO-5 TaxID=3446118 RepID=UPI003EBC311F
MTTDTAPDSSGPSTDQPVAVGSESELDDLVESNDVVLADFYADWCGPCQMLAPIVERIAAETDATVAKIDVDANQALAATYGVRGVPMLALFADGEQVQEIVGLQPEERLRSLVESHLE